MAASSVCFWQLSLFVELPVRPCFSRRSLAQTLVFVLFATTNIGYLWYNFIGCAAVLILAPVLQQTIFRSTEAPLGYETHSGRWITRLFVSVSNRADFFPSGFCSLRFWRPGVSKRKLAEKSSFSFTTVITTRARRLRFCETETAIRK